MAGCHSNRSRDHYFIWSVRVDGLVSIGGSAALCVCVCVCGDVCMCGVCGKWVYVCVCSIGEGGGGTHLIICS